jgi:hypothetical protein
MKQETVSFRWMRTSDDSISESEHHEIISHGSEFQYASKMATPMRATSRRNSIDSELFQKSSQLPDMFPMILTYTQFQKWLNNFKIYECAETFHVHSFIVFCQFQFYSPHRTWRTA